MPTRRRFVQATGAGLLAGLGDFQFLGQLGRVSAEDAQLEPQGVRLRPEIEPLVRLLEETPRGELLEAVAGRVRDGSVSYRDLLAALLLAGVRNIQPRPAVGFKFHAVLVVNSAHLASVSSPDEDRWLPIFWALDEFKKSQARDVEEGNWTMGPAPEGLSTSLAREQFESAMESWDVEAADRAVATLGRSAGAAEMFELFARLGARDFRSIGHKAIFVANSFRTLQCIGWQHAEPVLRSLAYALLNHEGEPVPAGADLAPDRPWRQNLERARTIRPAWLDGAPDRGATLELLETLREQPAEAACELVVAQLNRGIAPVSIYDALFLGAGELLMRQPGIVSLHAVTSTNALHYAFRAAADDETRRLLLLQNAAFVPLFRDAMRGRGPVGDARIDALEPRAPQGDEPATVESIFRAIGPDTPAAAGQVLGYLDAGRSPRRLIDAARRLVFLKGNDSHDYKFSSAVIEDFEQISPEWRGRFLAASVHHLRGAGDRDNPLVQRTRSALA